jgi:exodeoxyribonuclease-3
MQDDPKTHFWDAVLRSAEGRLHEPWLFIGDFNTGAHGVDEAGKTFVCAEHFMALSSLGWTDAWRQHNPNLTEWTWYSRFKGSARGNGFRLDHAFASPILKSRVSSCRYSHEERERGASDHSVLVLDLE